MGSSGINASPIHGCGVFAARDIQEREIIEIVPTLPVLGEEFEDTVLRDYLYEGAFKKAEDIDGFQLGFGIIYNDSYDANVSHYWFADTPYLQAWVADRFIPQGEEICHDYSKGYFETRDCER